MGEVSGTYINDLVPARLNKVVLAYSGGLDTSVIVPWLRSVAFVFSFPIIIMYFDGNNQVLRIFWNLWHICYFQLCFVHIHIESPFHFEILNGGLRYFDIFLFSLAGRNMGVRWFVSLLMLGKYVLNALYPWLHRLFMFAVIWVFYSILLAYYEREICREWWNWMVWKQRRKQVALVN